MNLYGATNEEVFLGYVLVVSYVFGMLAACTPYYPELVDKISPDVRKILRDNGLYAKDSYESPWLKVDGVPDKYIVYFYRAHEIPEKAKLETISYLMSMYEKEGRQITFILKMRDIDFEPRFSQPEAFFVMELKGEPSQHPK